MMDPLLNSMVRCMSSLPRGFLRHLLLLRRVCKEWLSCRFAPFESEVEDLGDEHVVVFRLYCGAALSRFESLLDDLIYDG